MATNDPTCNKCGRPRSEHETDPHTLEPTKCPVAPDTDGLTPANNGHLRERRNMRAADVDTPCSHQLCRPYEAEFETYDPETETWYPVCSTHVDPTARNREL